MSASCSNTLQLGESIEDDVPLPPTNKKYYIL